MKLCSTTITPAELQEASRTRPPFVFKRDGFPAAIACFSVLSPFESGKTWIPFLVRFVLLSAEVGLSTKPDQKKSEGTLHYPAQGYGYAYSNMILLCYLYRLSCINGSALYFTTSYSSYMRTAYTACRSRRNMRLKPAGEGTWGKKPGRSHKMRPPAYLYVA